jgi:hypothetical protein
MSNRGTNEIIAGFECLLFALAESDLILDPARFGPGEHKDDMKAGTILNDKVGKLRAREQMLFPS